MNDKANLLNNTALGTELNDAEMRVLSGLIEGLGAGKTWIEMST